MEEAWTIGGTLDVTEEPSPCIKRHCFYRPIPYTSTGRLERERYFRRAPMRKKAASEAAPVDRREGVVARLGSPEAQKRD